MAKAAAYTVTVEDLHITVGDGVTFSPPKGKVSPKNEYEETCLIVAVHNGQATPPTDTGGDE